MTASGHDPTILPGDLPVPEDDGAAAHLQGMRVPEVSLPSTDGSLVGVADPPQGFERLVLYAYPRTGQPGISPLVEDWDTIPGARGCTPEACGFRDHADSLARVGAAVVGVSTQTTEDQREVVARLALPFPLLSDADLRLARALALPTFRVAGLTLLKRLTLIVRKTVIEKVFYPVFPPDTHAEEVLAWLQAHDLNV